MKELDDEILSALNNRSRSMTYVVANILRAENKTHICLKTSKVLRRLKHLEKSGKVERVKTDYATQLCWKLGHNNN